nr:glycosyltransferase 87 family protein [Ancylobacter tetraedralis]
MNYHYYTAFAYLNDRIDIDAAPAQIIHSYFNPLVYLPFYVLLENAGPLGTSISLAIIHSANYVLVGLITSFLVSRHSAIYRWSCVAAATVIALASPMALSEVGTSFADILSAIPVLISVAILVSSSGTAARGLLLSGLLIGAATALKLTNGTFAISLGATCLICAPGMYGRLRAASLASIGLVAGFITVGGTWSLTLWTRFGNPIFPYYNSIFRSPDFPPTSDIDRRYIPESILDGVAYPFRWAIGIVPAPEIGFQDARFAALIVLLALCGAMALIGRRSTTSSIRSWATPGVRLAAFWMVSFIVWLTVFAIQRYIVVLELLCGPLAVLTVQWLFGGRYRIVQIAACGALAVAAVLTVKVPDWGHIAFTSEPYGLEVPAEIRGDHIFLMAGEPVSHVIPALSPNARFYGVWEYEQTMAAAGTTFTRRLQQAIREAGTTRIFVIANYPMTMATRLHVGSYGLQSKMDCIPITGFAYGERTNFACELQQVEGTGALAAVLPPDEPVIFGSGGDGFAILASETNSDWRGAGPTAVLQDGHGPSLLFRRPDGHIPSRSLRVDIAYEVAPGDDSGIEIIPKINGRTPDQSLTEADPIHSIKIVKTCIAETALARSEEGPHVVRLTLRLDRSSKEPRPVLVRSVRWRSDEAACIASKPAALSVD